MTEASSVHAGARPIVPAPLPPQPPLLLEGELRRELDQAHLALGRLDGVSRLLPAARHFAAAMVRKEVWHSERLEGARPDLKKMFLGEIEGESTTRDRSVRAALAHTRGFEHGLARVRAGFPLSTRVLREVQGRLPGEGSEPADLRTGRNGVSSSWLGPPAFLPPPPEELPGCMIELERFLAQRDPGQPALVKAGLAHAQWTTIRPFSAGNGRLGRILIQLILASEGVLVEPLLFLSRYFERHREAYDDLLREVRTEGDWEAWLSFFVRGVTETSERAVHVSRQVASLFATDRRRIERLGRPAREVLRLHKALLSTPLLTIARAARDSQLAVPKVIGALHRLAEMGIVREQVIDERRRVFAYDEYQALLSEGFEDEAPFAGSPNE